MSALPPKADMCGAKTNARFGPIADTCDVKEKKPRRGSQSSRLNFASRLRNRLFAFVAHVREMLFHASLDTATSRLNVRAILFDVRFASLPDGSLLHQCKLAAQRKFPEMYLDARCTRFARPSTLTLSF